MARPKTLRPADFAVMTTAVVLLNVRHDLATPADQHPMMAPGPVRVLIGAGTGLITPLGFAALAASTPTERLGQTMGAAELGRELGDAGGPLLVAGVATLTTLDHGYATLAVLVAIAPAVGLVRLAAGSRTSR